MIISARSPLHYSVVIAAAVYYFLILPLSLLPMVVLYRVSDLLYLLVYYLVPYRKRVIQENLKNAFPKKSSEEIHQLTQLYYRHFADLILESIKAFSISEAEILKRMHCVNPEIFLPYVEKNQNVLVGGGHYNNYEWFGVTVGQQLPMSCSCIYKPLSNPFFEMKMKSSREKYGLQIIPIREVNAWFEKIKDLSHPSLTIFATDQSPGSPSKAHWGTFLNQDTPMTFGLEKNAKATNYPVFFGEIKKLKRGYYEFRFSLISADPKNEKHGFITEEVQRRLELQIIELPQYWLWSHRRWKHKR